MSNFFLLIKIILCWFQNPLFIIKISNGNIVQIKGRVKPGFMTDCFDIITRSRIKSGLLFGVQGQFGKPILKASNDIPKDALQQLRNSWNYNS